MPDPEFSSLPPTAAEVETARRLGLGVDRFRQLKQFAGDISHKWEDEGTPADIKAEQASYDRLRREPGWIKPRNHAPTLLVSAAKAPGEIVQLALTILCYGGLLLAGLIACGPDRLRQIPGLLITLAMGVLVIPAMLLASWIWRKAGETARDFLRLLVRFWPVTLLLLVLLLGGLQVLLKGF